MMRVLVVEDEKLIRQGIKTMIQKSSVQVEEVLECKNGEEALAILEREKIDIVFTDIRMPKMNGIELIKNIYNRLDKPEVVIISGYDDFAYAVEVLKWGAQEYVLKPVHRDDIGRILTKLEKIVERKKDTMQKEKDFKSLQEQMLKYILINKSITAEEFRRIKSAMSGELLGNASYKVYCWFSKESEEVFGKEEEALYLDDIEGYKVLIAKVGIESEVLEKLSKVQVIGVSGVRLGLKELRQGYTEAYRSRSEAYLNEKKLVCFEEIKGNRHSAKIDETYIVKFVQQLGADKIEESEMPLSKLFLSYDLREIGPYAFEETLKTTLLMITETYQAVIESRQLLNEDLKNCFWHESLKQYKQLFDEYVRSVNLHVLQEHEDFKSKQKIKEALEYINANYSKNLNMAVVSNHVSMNYSFFSQIFKEYTGMNFVNYIKEVRINKSKQLLADTEEKVASIGQLVGYENEKHFMKAFKSVMGVSPTEYRKNVQIIRK